MSWQSDGKTMSNAQPPLTTTNAHSLRKRLLGSVMTAILLAALFQAVSAYRGALQQADEMFDYHLQQMAYSLRGGPALAAPLLEGDENADVDYVIQIWGPDGVQLFRSSRGAMPPRAVLRAPRAVPTSGSAGSLV